MCLGQSLKKKKRCFMAAPVLATKCDGTSCGRSNVPLKYSYESGAGHHRNFCNDCVASAVHRKELETRVVADELLCTVCGKTTRSLQWLHELSFPNITNSPTFAKMACSARCHGAVSEFARQATDDSIQMECFTCHKELTVNTSRRCMRCRAVRYCSTACQVQNWQTHKVVCKSVCTTDGEIKVTITSEDPQQLLARASENGLQFPPAAAAAAPGAKH